MFASLHVTSIPLSTLLSYRPWLWTAQEMPQGRGSFCWRLKRSSRRMVQPVFLHFETRNLDETLFPHLHLFSCICDWLIYLDLSETDLSAGLSQKSSKPVLTLCCWTCWTVRAKGPSGASCDQQIHLQVPVVSGPKLQILKSMGVIPPKRGQVRPKLWPV